MVEYAKNGKPIVYRRGVYYRIENDGRLHTDNDMIMRLQKLIPDHLDDKCPICEQAPTSWCRCPDSHRFCSRCGVEWHWTVDKSRGVLARQIDKFDKSDK